MAECHCRFTTLPVTRIHFRYVIKRPTEEVTTLELKVRSSLNGQPQLYRLDINCNFLQIGISQSFQTFSEQDLRQSRRAKKDPAYGFHRNVNCHFQSV